MATSSTVKTVELDHILGLRRARAPEQVRAAIQPCVMRGNASRSSPSRWLPVDIKIPSSELINRSRALGADQVDDQALKIRPLALGDELLGNP